MDYRGIDALIDSLQATVDLEAPQKGYWRGLWALVGEIKTGFNQVRYPTREEKQAAWERLNDLIERAKERGEREKEQREKRQKEWEGKVRRSEQTRSRLESQLGGTRPVTELERMIAAVVLAPLLLLEAALRSVLGLEQLDEILEDLKRCSSAMKEAWSFFSAHKGDMLPADKHAAYEQLNNAQERLNDAWTRYKEAKDRYHDERRREWQQRQANRRERIEANIEKLEAKLDKAEQALEHRRSHLSKLNSDYDAAWSEKFKER